MRRETRFSWGARTHVMGILNVTPDSFSGDGLVHDGRTVESAVEQARRFLAAGADILDIGGESKRPGAEPVGAEAVIDRVVTVIRAVLDAFPDAGVSIDDYRPAVAVAALHAGAGGSEAAKSDLQLLLRTSYAG